MLALVDQRADRRNRIFHHHAHGDRFLVKLNPACGNARDFKQFINDMRQLTHLTLNDAGGLLKYRVLDAVQAIPVAVQAQEKSGIEDGSEGVTKFMAEHRQELILAAVQVGERRRLLLRQSLEAAAFGDVTDVALNDLVVVLSIDVADELDFDLVPACAFQRQILVADVALLLQFPVNGAALFDVSEQANLPKFLAQELIVRVAQQVRHERVGVDHFSGVGVEDQDAVLGHLEQPPIPDFGVLQGGFRPSADR